MTINVNSGLFFFKIDTIHIEVNTEEEKVFLQLPDGMAYFSSPMEEQCLWFLRSAEAEALVSSFSVYNGFSFTLFKNKPKGHLHVSVTI